MKPQHNLVPHFLTALTALGLIIAPPAVADPVHPCEKEWLPDYSPAICEDGSTNRSLLPDGPGGPGGPAAPSGRSGPPGRRGLEDYQGPVVRAKNVREADRAARVSHRLVVQCHSGTGFPNR